VQAQCQFTAQRFDTLIPALRFKKFDAVIAGMEVICWHRAWARSISKPTG
jgi:ABC-type amino acid transport substrate-binding protein